MEKHILGEPVAATVISHRFSHVVWGAVFAGVVMTMLTQIGLALLGSSIGFSTLNITQGNNLETLGIGAVVWWVISGWISFYIGGLVSGRMAGIPRRLDGMLHGLLALAVTTVFVFFILTTTLGSLISGGFGVLSSSIQKVTSMTPQMADSAKAVLPQDTVDNFNNTRNQVRQVLGQIQDPAQRQELSNDFMSLSRSDNPDIQKQQIVNILTQYAGEDPTTARNNVERWSQNMQMIKENLQKAAQKAQEAAQAASKTAGKMAFASFIMLAFGALAAGAGGSRGAPHWSDEEIS